MPFGPGSLLPEKETKKNMPFEAGSLFCLIRPCRIALSGLAELHNPDCILPWERPAIGAGLLFCLRTPYFSGSYSLQHPGRKRPEWVPLEQAHCFALSRLIFPNPILPGMGDVSDRSECHWSRFTVLPYHALIFQFLLFLEWGVQATEAEWHWSRLSVLPWRPWRITFEAGSPLEAFSSFLEAPCLLLLIPRDLNALFIARIAASTWYLLA